MIGVELIAAERHRQVEVEGWSAEHDDQHTGGAMATAAGCYAHLAGQQAALGLGSMDVPSGWPWHPAWWKPSPDPARNLEKAGALVAAELDRLHRSNGDDR